MGQGRSGRQIEEHGSAGCRVGMDYIKTPERRNLDILKNLISSELKNKLRREISRFKIIRGSINSIGLIIFRS